MVLGELYLPFSLRGDKENIGGHQKGSIRLAEKPWLKVLFADLL
jgi:hypothetical protein